MRSRLPHAFTALAVVALFAVAIVGLLTAGPEHKDRAYELEQRLRCPVCKSVSIAESPSETAETMRIAVAQLVTTGRSDQQIIDYFRARYGDWVLLDPPASGSTLPLWVLLFAGTAVGGVALLTLRRRRPVADGALTPEQRERVARAVDQAKFAADDGDTP
ncbi:MAG: cytochrome c-type biogenesis protein [Haloechinothrix sp.]